MPRRANKIPADLRLYYIQRTPPTVPGIRNLQTYFPTLEVIFPSLATGPVANPTLAAMELAVSISGDTAIVENMVTRGQREVPVWLRPVHLLEPVDCVAGDYVLPSDGSLPAPRASWQQALRKINDPYNEAYTDAIFACMASRLAETGRSPHWCRFYGTVNGRATTYSYNVTEDMPDIEGEPWFAEGLQAGKFEIWAVDPYDPSVTARLERPWENVRGKLVEAEGAESVSLSSGSCIDADLAEEEEEEGDDTLPDLVEAEPELADEGVAAPASVRRPRVEIGGGRPGTDEDEGEAEEDDSTEPEDLDFKLVVPDFPVQMTVIERCDGTLDDLMEDEEDPDVATADMRETKEARWTAWIFQVIAALTVAQHEYDFLHNDLHTNNVLWCGTGETHLYYHVTGAPGGDRWYRVPTYGRIMKIIDFGRATFRPPGSNQIWLPDAYAPGGDAWGQYNFGAYFNREEPKVLPNRSFDLCRLAVAILDTLWPDRPDDASGNKILTHEPGRTTHETVSPLWNLLWLWLTDKNGQSVLVNPDDTERYPQFELYCAIARNVNNAVPAAQLTLPLFDRAFRCRRQDVPADAHVWRVQAR